MPPWGNSRSYQRHRSPSRENRLKVIFHGRMPGCGALRGAQSGTGAASLSDGPARLERDTVKSPKNRRRVAGRESSRKNRYSRATSWRDGVRCRILVPWNQPSSSESVRFSPRHPEGWCRHTYSAATRKEERIERAMWTSPSSSISIRTLARRRDSKPGCV